MNCNAQTAATAGNLPIGFEVTSAIITGQFNEYRMDLLTGVVKFKTEERLYYQGVELDVERSNLDEYEERDRWGLRMLQLSIMLADDKNIESSPILEQIEN